MQAGQLRHRVTIQRPPAVANALGEVETAADAAWVDVVTVAAHVEPTAAREGEEGRQQAHRTTHRVTMRYTPLLTPGRRLAFRGRVLDVAGVVNVGERNVELRLECSEQPAAAADEGGE